MSDNEGTAKKSGYRLEYASSARSKCKGPKPCSGNSIAKGELRLGSVVDFRGSTSYAWRHWGCTTTKVISSMKSQFESAEDLDGFDELKDEDKERIRKAWEDGKVADEDIPETAKKSTGDELEDDEEKPKKRAPAKSKKDASGGDGEKPKRKRAPPKAKKAEDEGDEAEPKKAPARKPRAKKVAASSDIEEKDESDEKPKKRAPARKPAAEKKVAEKKAPAKKRAPKKKDEEEESGEDFAEAIAEVQDDEEDAEEVVKKRKRPASSKPASTAKKPKVASKTKKSKEIVEEEDNE